jgi:hypothetical protein
LGGLGLNGKCFATTHYILIHHLSARESSMRMRNLKVLVKVVGIDEKKMKLELSDDSFCDYEDVAALQLDDNWFLFAKEMSLRCSWMIIGFCLLKRCRCAAAFGALPSSLSASALSASASTPPPLAPLPLAPLRAPLSSLSSKHN